MSSLRVVVVGARCRRQGIGEHVTRAFAAAGARVCAIVGTGESTVNDARNTLRDRYDIDCEGHTSLDAALAQTAPDVVALCSPFGFHLEQLRSVADAGVHCLCEKPLWWGGADDKRQQTGSIVDAFEVRDRYLDVLTQWPQTLDAYYKLHPELRGATVERFEMRMGPTSFEAAEMALDACPHPLSLLQSLVGPGRVSDAGGQIRGHSPSEAELRLAFDYQHESGQVAVELCFVTTPKPPRPASYAINGKPVERRVKLPEYDLYFESGDRSVSLEDPLDLFVRRFLEQVERRASIDRKGLVEGMVGLEALVCAAGRAERI